MPKLQQNKKNQPAEAPHSYQERLKQQKEDRLKNIARLARPFLEHPVAPLHPDEGSWKKLNWKPDQTVVIGKENGGFCFGWRKEIEQAANKPLMTFEKWVAATTINAVSNYALECNTVAKAGTWNAFQLTTRSDYDGETVGGWFVCHQDLDPVYEIRQIIYHTIARNDSRCPGGGGPEIDEEGTQKHHKKLGFAVLPRYVISNVYHRYDISDREAGKVFEEGVYLVDSIQAKRKPKTWTNCVRGMKQGFEDDRMARMAFDESGRCKAFLLFGAGTRFDETYFGESTAPLGQKDWGLQECFCPHHGFIFDRSISLEEYLSQSQTKICSNPPSYDEVCRKLGRVNMRKQEELIKKDRPKRSRKATKQLACDSEQSSIKKGRQKKSRKATKQLACDSELSSIKKVRPPKSSKATEQLACDSELSSHDAGAGQSKPAPKMSATDEEKITPRRQTLLTSFFIPKPKTQV